MIAVDIPPQTMAAVTDTAETTWNHESLADLSKGNISVSEQTVNDLVASKITADGPVKTLSVAFQEGSLGVEAATDAGDIHLKGILSAFHYEDGKLTARYDVKDKSLKGNRLESWIFSVISLSLVEKLMGPLYLGEGIDTTVEGNTVTVVIRDVPSLMTDSKKAAFMLNHLQIKGAACHDGYITLTLGASLSIVTDGLENLLS